MTERIARLLGKARRSLDNARRSAQEGDHDFAVSRAYYAMFYAAAALLLSKNRTFNRHSGLIAGFNQEFVRPGDLDRTYFGALEGAFQARNLADYGADETVSPETSERVLRDAASFLAMAETRLAPR